MGMCSKINKEEYANQFALEIGKIKREQGYSSKMRVFFNGNRDVSVDSPRVLETAKLIPEDFCEDENLFFWISIINVVVDNIRQNIYIRLLNKRLSHMYMHDAMTGIYNRFALKSFGEPLLERNQIEGRRTLIIVLIFVFAMEEMSF